MASISLYKLTSRAKLNNGQDAQGNMKYVNLSIGDMNETYWSANQSTALTSLLAVIGALEPCLNKTVEGIELVEYSNVSAA